MFIRFFTLMFFSTSLFAITDAEKTELAEFIQRTVRDDDEMDQARKREGEKIPSALDKYGGEDAQALYARDSAANISRLATYIGKLRSSAEPLGASFEKIVKRLGKNRRKLAQDTNSKNADYFGRWRPSQDNGAGAATPLFVGSQKFEYLYLKGLIAELLWDIKDSTSMSTPWITKKDTRHRLVLVELPTPREQEAFYQLLRSRGLNNISVLNPAMAALTDAQMWKKPLVNETRGLLYAHCALTSSQSPILRMIRLETEHVVNGTFIPATKFYTWAFKDKSSPNGITVGSIQDSIRIFGIQIVHTFNMNLPPFIQAAQSAWVKSIVWNKEKESLDDLRRSIAEFHYIIGTAMPFLRGAAAVAEWMSEALYSYHGYCFEKGSWKNVDGRIFAFQHDKDEFMRLYLEETKVSPMEKSNQAAASASSS